MSGPYWDEQWNPVVGCSPVSPGCEHCWAAAMESRFHPALARDGRWLVGPRLHPERLEKPFHWRRPRRVFVCNMGDLFHPDVPDEYIAAVFGVMAATPQHVYLVLSKRAERMREWFAWMAEQEPGEEDEPGPSLAAAWFLLCAEREHMDSDGGPIHCKYGPAPAAAWPLTNVWLGVSAEDQRRADERIPVLLDTPAAHRWVSLEPMLGRVDLVRATGNTSFDGGGDFPPDRTLDWCVVGCESGPHRRPMSLDWARSVRDQCQAAGVPFMLKQAEVRGKVQEFPELDGKQWKEVPHG